MQVLLPEIPEQPIDVSLLPHVVALQPVRPELLPHVLVHVTFPFSGPSALTMVTFINRMLVKHKIVMIDNMLTFLINSIAYLSLPNLALI
jgi:hypothetical protein